MRNIGQSSLLDIGFTETADKEQEEIVRRVDQFFALPIKSNNASTMPKPVLINSKIHSPKRFVAN